jgi:hypothetical protein
LHFPRTIVAFRWCARLVANAACGPWADWQMSGNDLTNDRNQRQETVLRTIPVLADGVLVVARQPKSFGAKHESSYLLGLNPKTGDFLWNAMLDKHPATMLTQSPVVYNGVVYRRLVE